MLAIGREWWLGGLLALGPALAGAQAPATFPARDLNFYLTQARQNSPLRADVRNQGRAVYTKAAGTLVGNYTAVPVLTRDIGHTRLSYAADATTNSYVGYDVALSNGALYQGHTQLTQPLFSQKRFEAYAQQAQG